jgi:hypothetical protein
MCRRFDKTKTETMNAGSKFSDESQYFHLLCGELAFVQKDVNGFWYFTTDKGYDFRESDRGGVTSRNVMLVILRDYDAETRENQHSTDNN